MVFGRHTSIAVIVAMMVGSVVLCTGCVKPGLDTVSVEGRVTYNGDPLIGGSVSFYPAERGRGRPTKAKINSDGTFAVKTLTSISGLVPGEYNVSVLLQKAPLFGATPEQLAVAEANLMELPEKFSDPETSGLRFAVESGQGAQTYDIQMID